MSGSVQTATDQSAISRATLGMKLITVSAIGLLTLGVLILIGAAWASYHENNPTIFKDSAQLLLSALLPLFGTWVGTVLAFYFSKENFDAASARTIDVLRATGIEKLRSIPAAKAMIPRARMVVAAIPAGGTLAAIPLAAVRQAFIQPGTNGQRISRLVFLDSAGNFAAVLHRSIWVEMLNEGLGQNPPINIATGTLGQLVAMPVTGITSATTYNDILTNAVAYTGATQTLADAKAAMEAVSGCQDVMVTQTGASSTPVIGWIMNADIGRLSEA